MDVIRFLVELVSTQVRTLQFVETEIELLQAREVADGRRDATCAWTREFPC